MRGRRIHAGAAAVGAALVLGGCGLGAGTAPAGVQLLLTRGFGAQTLAATAQPKLVGADTVMRVLQRNATVGTRYGGAFVTRIDGYRSSDSGPTDWFFYINGVQAAKGAAATKLHDGDHVWWDLHNWAATDSVPAVVGAYPEPFTNGISGKRLPTRVECTASVQAPCDAIERDLGRLGVPAALGGLGLSQYDDSLRVLVGSFASMRSDRTAALLLAGPARSGVYARFTHGGRRLELLDQRGRVRRTLGAGSGLIAATVYGSAPPVWIVTGTDAAGLAAAVAAFNAGTLDGHFALALSAGGALPLPLATSAAGGG